MTSANASTGLGISSTFASDGFSNNITHTSTGGASSLVNNFSLGAQVGNQIPATTLTGQTTGWTYNGPAHEATSFSVSAGSGSSVGLTWDGLGRLKTASLLGVSALTNTYAPSGLRVMVTDSVVPGNSRFYAYTRGGALLGEYTVSGGSPVWRRDVIYLGGRAIAEADAAGIHELHVDHLGTPRVITNGSTGIIEGRQAYASYGEKILTDGYIPLIGYTGHLQSDPTGLIYMRGRFYSPAWHVFINSDQGVDANSTNQMAYVGGSPFLGRDPSGMMIGVPEVDLAFYRMYGLMMAMAANSGGIPDARNPAGNSQVDSSEPFFSGLFDFIGNFLGIDISKLLGFDVSSTIYTDDGAIVSITNYSSQTAESKSSQTSTSADNYPYPDTPTFSDYAYHTRSLLFYSQTFITTRYGQHYFVRSVGFSKSMIGAIQDGYGWMNDPLLSPAGFDKFFTGAGLNLGAAVVGGGNLSFAWSNSNWSGEVAIGPPSISLNLSWGSK